MLCGFSDDPDKAEQSLENLPDMYEGDLCGGEGMKWLSITW
jgi:hypothetical protein